MPEEKKPHWTQTPKGKKKMAAMRRSGAYRAAAKRAAQQRRNGGSSEQEENFVAYAFGRCQGFLAAYAESVGLSTTTLAYRVGELLYRTSRRKVVGA